jgi:pyruvate kinase
MKRVKMDRHLRKTKIISTIGPVSNNPEIISRLLQSGVNVFRLNFSHGTCEIHGQVLNLIRQKSKELGIEVAVLADLQGPKIRTGKTPDNTSIQLETGSKVTMVADMSQVCSSSIVTIDYPGLAKEITNGQLVLINDGAISLRVDTIDNDDKIHCTVLSGGVYSSRKGVNFPDVDLSIPSMTEKDMKDLSFILENDFQYVALSFVRKADDVIKLKDIIKEYRSDIEVIAKIEKPEAARRIDDILKVSDGIMVARGDLGVEVNIALVPIIQKQLIEKANMAGKIVIVATQMLESMIKSPIPTRAETTDVANAVIDGADAIMLSGETATGLYPVIAVETMSSIARNAEDSNYIDYEKAAYTSNIQFPPFAICEAAGWASRHLGDIPVCVYSLTGATAEYLSKVRVHAPIFVFTPNHQVIKQLALHWNVTAFFMEFKADVSELHHNAEDVLMKEGFIKAGDLIVHICGTTPIAGATDTLRIKKVDDN